MIEINSNIYLIISRYSMYQNRFHNDERKQVFKSRKVTIGSIKLRYFIYLCEVLIKNKVQSNI